MSDPHGQRRSGYGYPPVHARWKKGQSGNPDRKRKSRPKTVVEMIDEFFASPIKIVENGEPRFCTAFEAIVTQLWIKADAGNKRAARVLLKYKTFGGGSSPPDIVVRRPIEDSGGHSVVVPSEKREK